MNQGSHGARGPRPTKVSLRERLRLAVHESLLDATERAIVEDGVEAASLQSIARRADVAVGTIYNYFNDRQELFRELFMKRRTEVLAAVDAGMKEAQGKPFEAQLESRAQRIMRVGVAEQRIAEDDVPLLAAVFTSVLRGVVAVRLDQMAVLSDAAPRVVELFCQGAVR